MREMQLPGFTAESSIVRISLGYKGSRKATGGSNARLITPQATNSNRGGKGVGNACEVMGIMYEFYSGLAVIGAIACDAGSKDSCGQAALNAGKAIGIGQAQQLVC